MCCLQQAQGTAADTFFHCANQHATQPPASLETQFASVFSSHKNVWNGFRFRSWGCSNPRCRPPASAISVYDQLLGVGLRGSQRTKV
jgi:hypothetical protein